MSVFRHIVLDTNVFVAAGFNPHSHAARLLAAVQGGALILVWHMETRAEVRYVLGRIPPLRQLGVAELFQPDAEYTAPLDLTPYACIPVPADRVFAALAEAARASLVTNDAHLMPLLHNYSGGGALWRQHGIHERQVLARNAPIAASSAALWELAQAIIAEAVERGFLPGSPPTSATST